MLCLYFDIVCRKFDMLCRNFDIFYFFLIILIGFRRFSLHTQKNPDLNPLFVLVYRSIAYKLNYLFHFLNFNEKALKYGVHMREQKLASSVHTVGSILNDQLFVF